MLVLAPQQVTLDGVVLADVSVLTVQRDAERTVVAWGDFGPHPTFADVPEVRTTIRIEQAVSDESVMLKPGRLGVLKALFASVPNGMAQRQLTARVVVTSVAIDLEGRKGPLCKVVCVAVATEGNVDPVSVLWVA